MDKTLSLVFTGLLLYSCSALALVNPIDQSLSETQSDLKTDTPGLVRNYSSLRESDGLFGKGWCTLWESKLKTSADQIDFVFCGAGKTVSFTKHNGRWQAPLPEYKLTMISNGYQVSAGLHNQFSFDKNGQLAAVTAEDGKTQLAYSAGRLTRLNEGKDSVQFTYSGTHVAQVQTSAGEKIDYAYKGDSLTNVKAGTRTLFTYEYNGAGILTKVSFNVTKAERAYAYSGRRVSSVETGACKEQLVPHSGGVAIKRKCGNDKEETRDFTFTGRNRATELTILEKNPEGETSTKWQNGRVVESQSPTTGLAKYSYDQSGLIKTIKSQGQDVTVVERLAGHVSRVQLAKQELRVSWQDGHIRALQNPSDAVTFQEAKEQFSVKAKNYALKLESKDGQRYLSGTLNAKPIPTFRVGSELKDFTSQQLDAYAKLSSLFTLKEQLEKL